MANKKGLYRLDMSSNDNLIAKYNVLKHERLVLLKVIKDLTEMLYDKWKLSTLLHVIRELVDLLQVKFVSEDKKDTQ